jgi:peroxiredoxin
MPHVLDGLTVFDPDGREIRLGQLWANETAVLVFVRHFGCLFCRQQIAALGPLRERVRALGAEVVVIGHGSVAEARAFRDEQAAPFPLFTDPTRQAYRAMEMRSGIGSILAPGVLARSLNAWRNGFRQTRVAGHPFQQGGVVVIAPPGVERYRFVSREAGEHPPDAEILAALAWRAC